MGLHPPRALSIIGSNANLRRTHELATRFRGSGSTVNQEVEQADAGGNPGRIAGCECLRSVDGGSADRSTPRKERTHGSYPGTQLRWSGITKFGTLYIRTSAGGFLAESAKAPARLRVSCSDETLRKKGIR